MFPRLTPVLVAGTTLFLTAGCAMAAPATPAEGTSSPSASPAPSDPGDTSGGDVGPHEAENNGWRYPRDMSPADKQVADAAAARVQPALEAIRRRGDLTPEAVRDVLVRLGQPADLIWVGPFEKPGWWTEPTPPPGVVYEVPVGRTACLGGHVQPDRVLVSVHGRYLEGGCGPLPLTH